MIVRVPVAELCALLRAPLGGGRWSGPYLPRAEITRHAYRTQRSHNL